MSWPCAKWALLAAGVSLASLIAVFLSLGFLGFGAVGVTEGSVAAAWQASIGNVAAGSIFSILTSIGMAGLSGCAYVFVPAAGAATAQALCKYFEANATSTA